MKVALPGPSRVRSVAGARYIAGIDEAGIEHGAVLTQLVLLALCTARTLADRLDGVRTIEGGLALGLAVILVTSLTARAIRRAMDGPTGGQGLPRCHGHWTLESRDARAG